MLVSESAKIVLLTTCLLSKPDRAPELLLDHTGRSSIADTFAGGNEPFKEYTTGTAGGVEGEESGLFADTASDIAAGNERVVDSGHRNDDGNRACGQTPGEWSERLRATALTRDRGRSARRLRRVTTSPEMAASVIRSVARRRRRSLH